MQLSAPVTACHRVVAPSSGKVSELASVAPLHIDGEAGPREERIAKKGLAGPAVQVVPFLAHFGS